MDGHTGMFKIDDLIATKACGLNAMHIYCEKNDDKPVGFEAANMDTVVEWCRRESLYVVMTFGNSHLPSYGKVVEFWKFYAPRYAAMTHVIYEIKNEACSATFHCADNAMQMYIDCHKIIRDSAPDAHVMFMSHSNLKGGLQSLYDDVERLGPDVDWTKASIAFHGYAPSAGEQVQMINAMGAEGYAMSCTEYPSGAGLTGTYESAGISYFHFLACWPPFRTPGTICPALKGYGLSYKPDFGSWPQPHVEHIPLQIVSPGLRAEDLGSGAGAYRLVPGAELDGAVGAVYDLRGRLLWRKTGEGGTAGGKVPPLLRRLAPRLLLVQDLVQ